MGESIKIEVSYSSQAEKKYYESFTSLSPYREDVALHVSPTDGVLELRALHEGGVGGSFLGSEGYLSQQPITQQLDLCEWYRFQKPGLYSVTFTNKQVSRVKSAEEGGGLEPLTLESNPVDFEILPADPAWDSAELSAIEQELNSAANSGERGQALQRLGRLDTPASVHLMVQRYLANTDTDGGEDWVFDFGLRESSQIDTIIPLLRNALSDPAANIPSSLPQLLADLETRKELGVMPAQSDGPAGQQKWDEQWKERSRIRDKYVEQANALLASSVEKRVGPGRATAIYQMWYDAVQLNATKPSPEVLSHLESSVLAAANDLDRERQVQFVALAWQTMPHEQLLPLVRKLAEESFKQRTGYVDYKPFELWCEGWPDECNAAILQNVIDTNARTDKSLILMMSEAEHPELDAMLQARLRDSAAQQDFSQLQRTAAAVLRAGSRNLVPAVDSFFDSRGCTGEAWGDLLAYLFRVAPEDAGKRLAAELRDVNDSCGSEVLRALHRVRPSDDIVPIAIKALDSPNLMNAQSAALYLGVHGPASAENQLWRRLEELWNAWQVRSSELPAEFTPPGSDAKGQAVTLERALASALTHATNWRLDPAEVDRLRSGCLTETCRDIADGKLFLNL
ncbi:MAG TPA: hypothetical protein VN776_02035 [Terracidiphilus sp.]|nr:hypothetical protein [Terracidiphilus sp.]